MDADASDNPQVPEYYEVPVAWDRDMLNTQKTPECVRTIYLDVKNIDKSY